MGNKYMDKFDQGVRVDPKGDDTYKVTSRDDPKKSETVKGWPAVEETSKKLSK